MAVVITPPENRLAMAKKPPNKLDAEVAGRVNEERKKGWNNGNMLLAIPNAFSKARFWRTKTQQTQALKK